VYLQLQSVSTDRSPLKRSVHMSLAPPKLDAFAETGFDADPTGMDLNADGSPDWTHSANSFSESSLNNGIWTADGQLIFKPDGLSAADVITVKARMRANDSLGPTIYGPYTINTDGEGLPLITQLRQDDEGGQELLIYNGFSLSDPVFTIPDLPSGLIDVTLTLLPDENYLSVSVNHEPVVALLLERVADTGTVKQEVWFTTSGGVAEFGSISVRVGGSYRAERYEDGTDGLLDILDLLF